MYSLSASARRLGVFLIALTALLTVAVAAPVHAATEPQDKRSISGRLTPPANVAADAYKAIQIDFVLPDGGPVWSTGVRSDWTWSFDGLVPGPYLVYYRVTDPSVDITSRWYRGSTNRSSATVVDVTQASRSGIDDRLVNGGSISGDVTLPGAMPRDTFRALRVNAINLDTDNFFKTTSVGLEGNYSLSGLPDGRYRLLFEVLDYKDGNTTIYPDLLSEYYNSAYDDADADLLNVTAGGDLTGIDVRLEQPRTLSGQITLPAGMPDTTFDHIKARVVNADTEDGSTIGAYADADDPGQTFGVDSQGRWSAEGLPPARYKVLFQGDTTLQSAGLSGRWFGNTTSWTSATVIDLRTATSRTGVNGALQGAGVISGKVTLPAGFGPDYYDTITVSTEADGVPIDAPVSRDGTFALVGLAPGAYVVGFYVSERYEPSIGQFVTPNIDPQWWRGSSSPAAATPITIGPGESITGVDATLTEAKPTEPVPNPSATFADISADRDNRYYSPFSTEIAWMASEKISTGWKLSDGRSVYRPRTQVARDAMAAFLYRASGSPAVNDLPTQSPFADVQPDDQFYKEIVWMYRAGISTGWMSGGQRYFKPLQPITRDAMAAFLYRAKGKPAVTLPSQSPFSDVATSNQFYREIVWMAQTKVSTGWTLSNGSVEYRPLASTLRDAMAAFIYRVRQLP